MKEIETIGTIARRGIAALKRGDYEAVGRAMTENQIMLRGLGVSCPELDALVRAAAPSSLGAKLTGAGGGGCMVALTRDPKTTSEAIELAGGRALISQFGNDGVRMETIVNTPLWSPDS
jgi:mevalonate kinase